jgi:hypothetical protein
VADPLFIKIDSSPASDSWGFVGRVLVGEHEAYRTIRAYPTPGEALSAAQELMAGVLGALLAGQEWRIAQEEFGHAPRRTELDFGLAARTARSRPEQQAVTEEQQQSLE